MSSRGYRSFPRKVRKKQYQGGASNPGGYAEMPKWAIRKPEQKSSFDYQRHLASREWALLREQVKERSGGLCERHLEKGWPKEYCPPGDNVHHLTYERVGHELLEDLQHVCRPCHEYISARSSEDPANLHLGHFADESMWTREMLVGAAATALSLAKILRDHNYDVPAYVHIWLRAHISCVDAELALRDKPPG